MTPIKVVTWVGLGVWVLISQVFRRCTWHSEISIEGVIPVTAISAHAFIRVGSRLTEKYSFIE